MKKSILILLIFFTSILANAQPLKGIGNCEVDSSKFYFTVENGYLNLNIKVDSTWQEYEIDTEPFHFFELNCDLIDFNGLGLKELVLQWKTSVYGNGGGGQKGGIQIWDLDKGVRIFDELNFYLTESFAREGAKPWYVSCEKKIKVTKNKIVVDTLTCNEEWNQSKMTPKELMENELFNLTSLKGYYYYEDGKLKKN